MHMERASMSADIDTVRREATRKRLLSQEWAGNSLHELVTTVSTLATLKPDASTTLYQTHLGDALSLCDLMGMAAETAATSIQIIADERLQLAKHTADTDACVAREEVEVQRLRKLLERERRVVDHRKQLDALANVILEYPTRAKFARRLEHAHTAARNVDRHIHQIADVRSILSKDLTLLFSCASSVHHSAKQFSHLVNDKAQQRASQGDDDDIAGDDDDEPVFVTETRNPVSKQPNTPTPAPRVPAPRAPTRRIPASASTPASSATAAGTAVAMDTDTQATTGKPASAKTPAAKPAPIGPVAPASISARAPPSNGVPTSSGAAGAAASSSAKAGDNDRMDTS